MKTLGKYFFWICCFLLACVLLTAHPATQGVAIGLATVPVTDGMGDPHARVILSVVAFVGLTWLSLWVVEAVALLVAVEIGRMLAKWYQQIRFANEEIRYEQVHA